MRKRIVAWLCLFAMLFALVPAQVLAEDAPTIEAPEIVACYVEGEGVYIEWEEVEGATCYNVYVKMGDFQIIAGENVTDTWYTVPGDMLTHGSTYTFRVTAMDYTTDPDGIESDYADYELTFLAAPTVAVKNTSSGIQVSWDAMEGAQYYDLFFFDMEEDGEEEGSYNIPWVYKELDTTSFKIPKEEFKSGREYCFYVSAVYGDGDDEHAFSENEFLTYLDAPVITKTRNVNAGIEVTWDKVDGATSYIVMYKTNGGKWETYAEGVTATKYVVKKADLKSGTKYWFTIRAVDEDGTVSGYTSGKAQTYMTTPAVTKTRNVNAGIEVTWGKVTGATSYILMYKTDGGSWKTYKSGITATKFVVPKADLKSGTKYWFTVKAKGAATSGYSGGKAQTYMTTPVVKSAVKTSSGVKVTWGSVTGATSYTVMMKPSGGSWTTVKSGVTGTSYTVPKSKLTSGKTYSFTVKAKGAATSGYSSGKSLTYKA